MDSNSSIVAYWLCMNKFRIANKPDEIYWTNQLLCNGNVETSAKKKSFENKDLSYDYMSFHTCQQQQCDKNVVLSLLHFHADDTCGSLTLARPGGVVAVGVKWTPIDFSNLKFEAFRQSKWKIQYL